MSPEPAGALPVVPGFELLRPIGQGGAGTVYEAHADDDLRRRFAIKVFPPARREDYERELRTLRAIEDARAAEGSTDLVETISAGETEHGLGYVVMSYASGGDLQARVREDGPLSLPAAVDAMLPVLRGLTLLHRHGMVHKDVKPANVLVGDDGRSRLGDFGLTRALDAGPLSSAGTPGFCAPEVIRGRGEHADERIDVYSAAATLYFLLTGEAPLPGRPDLFLLERRRVDRPLQDLLFRALAEEPDRRPVSAEALALDLERWKRGELKTLKPVGSTALLVGALLGLIALGVVFRVAWPEAERPRLAQPAPSASLSPLASSSPAAAEPGPPAPWSWDGLALTPAGAEAPALLDTTWARARDPAGHTFAAAGPDGAVVVAGRDGEVRLRIPGPADAAGPLYPSLALLRDHLARLLASGDPDRPDVLEVFRLDGSQVARWSPVPVASAVALLPSGDEPPGVALGTPDGRVLLLDRRGQVRLSVRTHRDEVLALAVDPQRDLLLVLGDDRGLAPAEAGGEPQLEAGPRLTLKAYSLEALLSSPQPEPLQEAPTLERAR